MSYILDALKKSDRERKRGDVPNLQTIHIPINVEQQKPWALYGLISVLLLMLAFFIGFILSNQIPTDDVSQINYDKTIEVMPLEISEKHASAAESQSIPANRVEIRQQQNIEAIHASVELKSVKKEVQMAVVPKAIDIIHENIPELETIPYLHELDEYKQQSVPQLSFAGHVYSSSPSSRSVIINGDVMSEGDTIVQGINMIEITTSGVIFSLHGELFRMDILQDWSFE